MGGFGKTCEVCQRIWKQVCRDVNEPHPFAPCEQCPAVALTPGNYIVWTIYERVWNQFLVVGMGTVIGVQIDAIYRVMDSLDVPKDEHLDIIDRINLIHPIMFPQEKSK